MSYFGKIHLAWLRKFHPFKNGVPPHVVRNRLFNRLNTKEFNACFIKWVDSIG
ncbi:MAG TPA: hypothetical protein DCS19_11750 [Flavobacterium sp.]|nr:hypothetical protein [Flavobacterium sp.]